MLERLLLNQYPSKNIVYVDDILAIFFKFQEYCDMGFPANQMRLPQHNTLNCLAAAFFSVILYSHQLLNGPLQGLQVLLVCIIYTIYPRQLTTHFCQTCLTTPESIFGRGFDSVTCRPFEINGPIEQCDPVVQIFAVKQLSSCFVGVGNHFLRQIMQISVLSIITLNTLNFSFDNSIFLRSEVFLLLLFFFIKRMLLNACRAFINSIGQ